MHNRAELNHAKILQFTIEIDPNELINLTKHLYEYGTPHK